MKLYLVFEPNRTFTDGRRVWAEASIAVCPAVYGQDCVDTLVALTDAVSVDCMAGEGDSKEFWGLWTAAATLQAVEL